MEKLQDHITRIYTKLQQLLKQLSSLQKINEQQKAELLLLQEENSKCIQEIKLLQEQNYILKAATNTMNEQEKIALEQSINKYIRDIDKCISHLNE